MEQREQPDLLGWRAPEPVKSYRAEEVAAATLGQRLSRAIAQTLRQHHRRREDVAEAMSAFLGVKVSKNMLDAYASQAREEAGISVVRLAALIHATGDRRLLELVAELFGWSVIERKFLRLIELAAVREQADALARRGDVIRREAKRQGLL